MRSHLIAKIGGYEFERSALIYRNKLTRYDIITFVHRFTFGVTEDGKKNLKVYFNGNTVYEDRNIVGDHLPF